MLKCRIAWRYSPLSFAPWRVGSALTLSGPFVRLQHQVLFGLFQFFLQTLVLGSDFTDSLLAVLQQAKLGADIHHLLPHRERTDRCGFYSPCTYTVECAVRHMGLFQQQPAYHSRAHTYSHLIDCHCDRSRVFPDTELLHWSCWGLSGFLKDAAGKIYISCFSLPPSFTKPTLLPPLNT